MNFRIKITSILFIFIIVYVGACRKAGVFLVKKDEPLHSDAIVFLMGSIIDRIMQALDLYKEGLADRVILVEGGMGPFWDDLKQKGASIISSREQVKIALEFLGIPSDSVTILSGDAESTLDEALLVRNFIDKNPEIDTLFLVSSSFHMRRAFMTFDRVFNKSQRRVYIICCPSSYTVFNPEKWWKSKNDIEIVLLEYLKLANFILFERL